MKSKSKKLATGILILTLFCSLCGCSLMGNTKKDYENYIQALMDVNYKAYYDDYLVITGVSLSDAEAVYNEGIDNLADQLMNTYGIQDVEGSDLHTQFEELARNIYSHASYEITNVDKVDGTYTVTVTIYPIDILVTTYPEVTAYIQDMNTKVDQGVYNDYELSDYQLEYAEGILQILNHAFDTIGNSEGVAVTVTILDNEEYYYISDNDFLALDRAILDFVTVGEDGTLNHSSGTDQEAPSEP